MPELPEVETLVRALRPLAESTIRAVELIDPKLSLPIERVVGAVVSSVKRRGKYIVLNLGDRGTLAVHLRMSGRLLLDRSEQEVRYTRMVIRTDAGRSVYFVDPRRLGTVTYFEDQFDCELGIDPTDPRFTPDALADCVGRQRAPIKQALLDQRRVAGLGNIYAAEALWHAGIDPRRPAADLTRPEIERLHRGIVDVLVEAIDEMGSRLGDRVSDYRPSNGAEATFQNRLRVYGRSGTPCARCGTAIERIVQGARSTCYCPECQR